FDTDSQALIADVNNLKNEATQSRQQHRFGVAIKKFKQLEGSYPAGSTEAADAKAEYEKLEAEGKAAADALKARVDGAMKFRDVADLKAGVRESERLAQEYAEHDAGVTAAAQGKAAAEKLAEFALGVAERQAGPYLRKAEDFDARGKNTLAKAFYAEIV